MQDAARRALGGVPGRPVDDAIAASLKQPASDPIAVELLKAVADRRIFLAKPAVSGSLLAPSAAVRVEGMKTFRAIGSPSDASPVLDMYLKAGDDLKQAEAEKTVIALLQKTAGTENRSRLVRMRLMTDKDAAVRGKLIALLAPTADGAALPVLRRALDDADPGVADAAARAIAEWPVMALSATSSVRILTSSRAEKPGMDMTRQLPRTATFKTPIHPTALRRPNIFQG